MYPSETTSVVFHEAEIVKSTNPPSHIPPIKRLWLWEIEGYFRCPTIGLCLMPTERKRLLKKAGVRAKGKNDFQIHEILVAHVESENPLSRKADRLLHQKFGRTAAEL